MSRFDVLADLIDEGVMAKDTEEFSGKFNDRSIGSPITDHGMAQ